MGIDPLRKGLCALALALGCGADDPAPSAPETGGFVERAVEAGLDFEMTFLEAEQGPAFKINLYDHGAGVAVADVDGDGDDDVYLLNQLGGNALFRNEGNGIFTDVTKAAGPVAFTDRVSTAAAFNDVDGDGDQDLFVTSTRGGNAFLRNDGAGRFTDATEAAGLGWVGHSQGAAFFDADGDGWLDLLVTNTARWTTEVFHPKDRYYLGVPSLLDLVDSPIEHNRFYRNRGDGTFEDATERAGLAGVGWGGDIAVFDFDGDGDLDLFVANMFGRSLLYANDGRGRFTDVTEKALGRTSWGTVGAKAFDYDGDGRLDLMLADMHSDMWVPFHWDLDTVEPQRKYDTFFGPMVDDPSLPVLQKQLFLEKTRLHYGHVFFGNALYRNQGDGTFEEVSDAAGAETFWPWGIAPGDFDNDGDMDVYLPSGMGYPWEYWRSPLLRNEGDGTFTECSARVGLEPPPGGPVLGRIGNEEAVKSSRSAAVADFDGDGRLDLVVNNFNERPYLYLNRFPKRGWIAFRLRGRPPNRDAVGALVRLRAGGRTQVRQVHAAGGYLAQSSKVVHFGLGDAAAVERCEIRWPGGRTQLLDAPAPGRLHVVAEPAE